MEIAITKIIEESGVELEKAKRIWVQFEEYFDGAIKCAAEVEGLEITDVSQKDKMKLARATRLTLKNIRIAAEKTKKELKADILKEGRFIDATFNLIADTTKPIEADLLEKEQFAKRKEEELIRRLVSERESALLPLGVDVRFLDLAKMSNADYDALLEKSTREHEERLEAERKAKEERLAREKAAAEERARIEAENAHLRAEAEERERQLAEERAKLEAERRVREEADRRERQAREAAERAEREKHEKEIRKAREEAEAAQRALREKAEAEERAKREEAALLEAQRRAEEEERKRLEAAGDKEKLTVYFDKVLSMEVPTVKSGEAEGILALMRNCIQVCVSRVEKL